MKARNENLTSIDAIMDAEFGKPGTPEREEFRKEAYAYCMGQIICDARKKEKMTQSELAEKIGTNKSYISRIEKGIVDPGISTFRPYGIHIDYARKGFVLFNHYTNSLGKQETGSIEGLPLEKFEDVDAIPLNGKIIKNGNQTTDIYFYTDDSNPYKNMKLDMDALKQYNRFIYPLSLFLDRIL